MAKKSKISAEKRKVLLERLQMARAAKRRKSKARVSEVVEEGKRRGMQNRSRKKKKKKERDKKKKVEENEDPTEENHAKASLPRCRSIAERFSATKCREPKCVIKKKRK